MLMSALERRDPRFIIAFACGCALSSVYGFLSGAWPFGVVEVSSAGLAASDRRRCTERCVRARQRLEHFQNRIAWRAMPLHFRADGARTISGRRRPGATTRGRNFVPKFVLDPANLSAPERT
jgi:hypothetical protein